jgi:hypothetical protein
MQTRASMMAALAFAAMAFPAAGAPPGSDDILWYYDAETALEVARKSERPIVLLKVRADIGPDVKT